MSNPTATPATTTTPIPTPPDLYDRPPRQTSYRAGLLVWGYPAIVLVVIATICSLQVLDQLGKDGLDEHDRFIALGVGLIVGVVFAVAYAKLSQDHTSPDHMNPRQYGELRERWTALSALLEPVCPPTSDKETQATACRIALAHRYYMAEELEIVREPKKGTDEEPKGKKSKGVRWVVGSGFIELWRRLHDAEAALLLVQARERVVANALVDELRLMDSKIPHRDHLLDQLRRAVTDLGGTASLVRPTAAENPGATDTTAADGSTPAPPEIDARLVLANTRRAINSFRDESRAGLLDTRNYLLWTGMIAGLVTYALLVLAILADASPSTIVAAWAFFLVGGLVGIFTQLRRTSLETVRSGEDDFGLAQVRLVYVPVLSGLAGIGGVLVMTMLYPAIGVTLDVNAEPTTREVPLLADIFDLSKNGFGLVIAAVFGLTPDLLINRLQHQADQYKTDLAQTGVETRVSTPPT